MSSSEDDLAINSFSTSNGGIETVPMSAAAALTSSALTPDEFAMASAFSIESVQASGNMGKHSGQETQISYSATNVFPKISDRWIVWEEWTNGRSDVRIHALDSGSFSSLAASNYPRASPDTSGEYIVYEQVGVTPSSSKNINIHVYDSITQSEKAIAPYAANQHAPAISGRYVVWHDWRSGVPNIYLADLSSGSVRPISSSTAEQLYPAISGNNIVWEDWRSGNADIYLYDIVTGTERQLTHGSGNEQKPRISGNVVVWQDDRAISSSIYALTLDNMVEVQISFEEGSQVNPDISGGLVVWEHRFNSVGNIHMLDLMENRIYQITDSQHDSKNPSIYGTNIVWEDYRSGSPNIYMFHASGSDPSSISAYRFYGTVHLDNNEAQPGTVVEAVIDGVVRGSFTLVAPGLVGNSYGPYLEVPIFSYDYGKTIQFYVNKYLAVQTVPVATPGISQISLNAINSGTPPVGTYTLQGTLYIDGQPAPQGTVLTAYVGSSQRATTTVYGHGQYNSFVVPVYPQDMGTTLSFSAVYGQRISQSTTQIHIGEKVNLPYDIFCAGSSLPPSLQTPVFSGTVMIDAMPAPVGSVVSAFVGDVVRAQTTLNSAGQYSNLAVPVSQSDIGKRITFYITSNTMSYQAAQSVTVGNHGTSSGTIRDSDTFLTLSAEENLILSTEESGTLVALESSDDEFSAASLTLIDPSHTVQAPSYVRLDLTASTGISGGTSGITANAYSFSGFAQLDGAMLPAGTVISAYVNNELRGTATTQTLGQYTNLRVPITHSDYGRSIYFTAVYAGQSYQASQQITIGSSVISPGIGSPGTGQDGSLIGLSIEAESTELSISSIDSDLTALSLNPNVVQTKLDLTFVRSHQQTGSYQFYGIATLDGTMLPAGAVISAYVNNELRGTATTQTLGQYTNLRVPITHSDYGRSIHFTAVHAGQSYQASQQITVGSSVISPGIGSPGTGQDGSLISLSVEAESAELSISSIDSDLTALSLNPNAVQTKLDLTFARSHQQAGSYQFYGIATIDGVPAPIGTQITAKVGNEVRTQIALQTAGSYHSIDVPIYTGDYGKKISFLATYGATTYEATQFAMIDGIASARKQLDLNFITLASSTYRFYGTARIDGQNIPAHTTIYATVDDEVRGSFAVTHAGQYGSASGMKLEVPVYRSDIGKYINFKTVSGAEATQSQRISGGLTVRKDLTFRTAPLQSANFDATPVSGISPLTVSFRDRSSSAPNEWYWEFGDGSISAERNPSHTYREAGQYTVRLTVGYPNNGPIRQEIKYNYINVQKGAVSEALISLSPGWNFISTPKTLAANWDTAEKLFASVPVAGHSVFSFNPRTNQWAPLTAKSVFKPFEPVWIYSEYPTSIQLYFGPDAMQIPPIKHLTKGWNAFGITSLSQTSAQNALLSIKDDWVYVIGYNAATQRYEQTIMNVPESYNNILVPGKGYWIYMNDAGELAGLGV